MITQPAKIARGTAVVLIHGLAASKMVMSPLARAVRRRGFRTFNWGYPSIWRSISRFTESFATHVQKIAADPQVKRIHIVGHSMGSIITRNLLQHQPVSKIERVVQLAPPNRGSPVARKLAPWLGRICQPLHELSDDDGSFVNQLGDPNSVELGIIAANWDYMVPLSSTPLTTQADYLVVSGMHSSILFSPTVARQTIHFLEHGRFDKQAEQSSDERHDYAQGLR